MRKVNKQQYIHLTDSTVSIAEKCNAPLPCISAEYPGCSILRSCLTGLRRMTRYGSFITTRQLQIALRRARLQQVESKYTSSKASLLCILLFRFSHLNSINQKQYSVLITKMSTTITQTQQTAPEVKNLDQYKIENLKPYVHPPETQADLPWSELVTLDLEDYDRPGGKERLAKQLEHAVHHVG